MSKTKTCKLCGSDVSENSKKLLCSGCITFNKDLKKALDVAKKKGVADKDNLGYLLACFSITKQEFDSATHEDLSSITGREFIDLSISAKDIIWQEFHERAFSKIGVLNDAFWKDFKYATEFMDEALGKAVVTESLYNDKNAVKKRAKPSNKKQAKPSSDLYCAKSDTWHDKDNKVLMLRFMKMTEEQYSKLRNEDLKDWLDDDYGFDWINDSIWHHYRTHAFTKAGKLRAKVLAEIDPLREAPVKRELHVIPKTYEEERALINAVKNREDAKKIGAKALRGSVKQKSWGETLRKGFLAKTKNKAAIQAVINDHFANTAKFWIETRGLSVAEIEEVLVGKITFEEALAK